MMSSVRLRRTSSDTFLVFSQNILIMTKFIDESNQNVKCLNYEYDYNVIHVFSLFSYSCTALMHTNSKFIFRYLWPCIHARNHAKLWLKFYIHVQFRAKNDLFRMNGQFGAKLVSYWYKIDAKCSSKTRNCCFVKPYFCTVITRTSPSSVPNMWLTRL